MSAWRGSWLERLEEYLCDRFLGKPRSQTSQGWAEWRKQAKKAVVTYFLLVTFPGWIRRAGYRLRDWKFWVYYRIHPKHRYHMLRMREPGYRDPGQDMIYALFALLDRYVEECGGVDELDKWSTELEGSEHQYDDEKEICDSQASHQREAAFLYRWWHEKRPLWEKQDPHDMVGEPDGEVAPGIMGDVRRHYSREQYMRMAAIENAMAWEDTEMMTRLIELRRNLWT